MARLDVYHHSLNVGVVDKKHLARVDLERMRLAAETQKNIIPLTTGPAFGRPGLEYISSTDSNDVCRLKEFVFGATDAVLMEFTDYLFRARVDDVLVTRPAVTATVGTGYFGADASWTKTATTGATVTISGGFLNLTATAKGSRASATQTITVNEADTEHALRIVIERGPVKLRVGSTSGGDEYVSETTLRTGTHSLAFTPTGANFYIEFFSKEQTLKRVQSCIVESSGVMTLPTQWDEDSLFLMRFAQSADVVFVACSGVCPQRIERRSNRSWSIVDYTPGTGPFTSGRTRDVKLTPSVTEGNGTLTADAALFNSSHVGALFTLFHEGFECSTPLAGEDQFTSPFKVTGIKATEYTDRNWEYTVTGTWSGTLRWFRSFDSDVSGFRYFRKEQSSSAQTITTNVSSVTNDDDDDNAIVWYKIGFESGLYTSGTATIAVDYDGGGGSGIARVTGYTSATEVDIEVLRNFNGTSSTADWRECEWSNSTYRPTAVTFAEGRLWWSAADRIWASVSDDYENFDDEIEGDAGPISRSIATGGVNATQWLLSVQRLLIGTDGSVATCKSSSLDEPITPSNLSIKESSTTGAAAVDPVKIDGRGVYVERSGTALMELTYDSGALDYQSTQLSKLCTDLFAAGVKTMAIQRRPDSRIWVVMDDGTCVCVVYEPGEDVLAFIEIETDGQFESVAVLPEATQDAVYFVVNRTINSSTVRYVEKLAKDSEVKPSTTCKVMDAFASGTNSPASTTINVGTHLEGEDVVVWADGAPLTEVDGDNYTVPLTYTVDGSGNITVSEAVTDWVAGLPYTARYKSARLAYGANGGTPMLKEKKVAEIGMILTDFVRSGLRYGTEFDNSDRPLFPPPPSVDGTTADDIVLSTVNDEKPFAFPGEWDVDSRVCIEWQSPFTATVMGLVFGIETNA